MTSQNTPVPGGLGPQQMPLEVDESHSSREENELELREVAGLTQGQLVRRRFFRHKGAMISMVVLILVAILAFSSVGFGPIPGWWDWGPRDRDPAGQINEMGAPTFELFPEGGGLFTLGSHPFGQNQIGQDLFAQTMLGTQTSLIVMVLVGLISGVVGVVVGALAGFFRGWLDGLLMRLTDLVITIPAIVLGSVLGKLISNPNTMEDIYAIPVIGTVVGWMSMPVMLSVVLGLTLWTGMARLVRGDFLALREREFVDAARVAGASNSRIIFKHILPNAVGVVIVNATLLMASAVLLETALAYLGFGLFPPNYSLGSIINNYQGAFATRPWTFWIPGILIVLIALSVNFIGDGLRDAFDPRQKRVPSARAMRKADAKLNMDSPVANAGGVQAGGPTTRPEGTEDE
jgi:peptide/nickel transport system permease protein